MSENIDPKNETREANGENGLLLFRRSAEAKLKEQEKAKERAAKSILSESPPPHVREKLINDEKLEFSNYQACGLFFRDVGLNQIPEEKHGDFMEDMIRAFSDEAVNCYIRPRDRDPGEEANPGEHFVVKHFGEQRLLVDAALRFSEKSKDVLEKYDLHGKVHEYWQISIGKTPKQKITYDRDGNQIIERPNNEIDLIQGAVAAKGQFFKEGMINFEDEFERGELLPILVFGEEEGMGSHVFFDDKTDKGFQGVLLRTDRVKNATSTYTDSTREYSDAELEKLNVAFDEPFATQDLYDLLSDTEREALIDKKSTHVELGKRRIISYDVTGSTRIAQLVHDNPQAERGMNAFYEELQSRIIDSWKDQEIVVSQSAGDGQTGISKMPVNYDGDDYVAFAKSLLVIPQKFNELIYDENFESGDIPTFLSLVKESYSPKDYPHIKVTGALSEVDLKMIPSAQTLITYIKNEEKPVDLEEYLGASDRFASHLAEETGSMYHNVVHIDENLYDRLRLVPQEELKKEGILVVNIDGEHFVMDISS